MSKVSSMGFMDKAKATLKNADSKLGQEIDEGKMKNEISGEKSKISKAQSELGGLYYGKCTGNAEDFDEKSQKLIDDMKAAYDKIAEIEAKIEELRAKGHEEREANRNNA